MSIGGEYQAINSAIDELLPAHYPSRVEIAISGTHRGRRRMMLLTYGRSGVVLAVSAVLSNAGTLNTATQTLLWCVSSFVASARASSAYLTAREIFPLERRSQTISCVGRLRRLSR